MNIPAVGRRGNSGSQTHKCHKRNMATSSSRTRLAVVPLFLACYFGQCSYLEVLLAFHIRPIGTTTTVQ
jgi:hypothetical protein